jgi:hypothetical protein
MIDCSDRGGGCGGANARQVVQTVVGGATAPTLAKLFRPWWGVRLRQPSPSCSDRSGGYDHARSGAVVQTVVGGATAPTLAKLFRPWWGGSGFARRRSDPSRG